MTGDEVGEVGSERTTRAIDHLERSLDRWSTEQRLIGLALWRVSTGLCLLYWYLSHYLNRWYLWGPNGVYPHADFAAATKLSLYALSHSPVYFEVLFHLGVLIAVLFTLGWNTRIVAPLNLVFHYSLFRRNPFFPNGGDNLAVIVQLLLLFANTKGCCALDARRARRAEPPSLGRRLRAVVHNGAVVAAILQLCTLYTFAGLHKASGEMWYTGTALYYILNVAEYAWPPYSTWLTQNAYLVVGLSYATVVFQLGFPLALVSPKTRYLWMLGGLAFHGGIALMMALWTFSWFVLSVYCLLLSDGEYARLGACLVGSVKRVRGVGWRRIGVANSA
jgi:hypothetical protein